MTGAAEWKGQVGATWAQASDATDRSFAPVTARLLALAAAAPFARAVDIGCGAGETTCRLAASHPEASVVGIDISPELLATARARCSAAAFVEADAATYRPLGPVDLLLSRHGVMFFADPVAAFRHLLAIAAPAARLIFSCFRRRGENRWALDLDAATGSEPEDPVGQAPGPFAFGSEDHTRAILASAGWREIAFERLDYAMVVGEGADAVTAAMDYFRRIGPAARALATLDGPARAAALERLEALCKRRLTADRVALPAAAWIVTARAPA